METQSEHLIKKTLSSPSVLDFLKSFVGNLIEKCPKISRNKIAEAVCKHFNFFNTKGKLQSTTCSSVLTKFEKEGKIELPESRGNTGKADFSLRCLDNPIEDPVNIPDSVGYIQDLRIILVKNVNDRLIWNTIIKEHPLPLKRLIGRQLLYLIKSEHGYLGAISFSGALYNVPIRDSFINWSDEQKEKYINNVICMSRFFIRNSVRCKYLASKVLSLCMKRFSADFKEEYGYEPLMVESYIGHDYDGTSYKAANWTYLGITEGYDYNGSGGKSAVHKKDYYLYILKKDFRKRLGVVENKDFISHKRNIIRSKIDGLHIDKWLSNELGNIDFGDIRRTKTFLRLVTIWFSHPDSALGNILKGKSYEAKVLYDFLESKNKGVNEQSILSKHAKNTLSRIKLEKVALHVVDGLIINEDQIKCISKQLGDIGKIGNKIIKGFKTNNIFTMDEDAIPLGISGIEINNDHFLSEEEKLRRKELKNEIPVEEKKTFVWIKKIRIIAKIAEKAYRTQHIFVADRECDNYDIFFELHNTKDVDYVIRASSNRYIYLNFDDIEQGRKKQYQVFNYLREQEAVGYTDVIIPSDNKGSKPRTARLKLTSKKIILRAPGNNKTRIPLQTNVIMAREECPPEGCEAIEWVIYTSLPVDTKEDIIRVINIYKKRWRIEEWHRVLKEGLSIDELQYRSIKTLNRVIAIKMIFGWYVMLITLLGRMHPDLPANFIFSDLTIDYLKSQALKNGRVIDDTLGEITKEIAYIGGHLDQKDRNSGFQTTLDGLERVFNAIEGINYIVDDCIPKAIDESLDCALELNNIIEKIENKSRSSNDIINDNDTSENDDDMQENVDDDGKIDKSQSSNDIINDNMSENDDDGKINKIRLSNVMINDDDMPENVDDDGKIDKSRSSNDIINDDDMPENVDDDMSENVDDDSKIDKSRSSNDIIDDDDMSENVDDDMSENVDDDGKIDKTQSTDSTRKGSTKKENNKSKSNSNVKNKTEDEAKSYIQKIMLLLGIAPDIKCKMLKHIRKHNVLSKFKNSIWSPRLEGILLEYVSVLHKFAMKNLLDTS